MENYISNNERFDKKKIRNKIFTIIIPIVIENILQLSTSFISMAIIGRVGVIAVNSISLSSRITQMIWALFRGLATGTSVFVSQAYGAHENKKLRRFSIQALISSIILVIILTLIIFFNAKKLLFIIFNPSTELLNNATTYLKIVSIGLPFMAIMLIVTGILQGMHNTKTPMYIAFIMNVVNLILNLVLIHGYLGFPALGIKGAAIALVISEGVGATIGIMILLGRNGVLQGAFNKFKLNLREVANLYKVGIPASLESIFWQIAAIFITKAIMTFGENANAAYQLGLQAEAISYLPAAGFAIATTTLIGQAIGENDPEIGKLYLKELVKETIILTSFGTIILMVFPSFIISIFTNNDEVIRIGAQYLFAMGIIQIPQNLAQVYNGALRGAGFTKIPMTVALIGLWGIRVPLALVAAYVLKVSISFIWLAIALDLVFRFILSYFIQKKKNIFSAQKLI